MPQLYRQVAHVTTGLEHAHQIHESAAERWRLSQPLIADYRSGLRQHRLESLDGIVVAARESSDFGAIVGFFSRQVEMIAPADFEVTFEMNEFVPVFVQFQVTNNLRT